MAVKRSDRVSKNGKKYHVYYIDGQHAPGVTTILNGALNKPALLKWAPKAVAEWVADHLDEVAEMKAWDRDDVVKELKETPWRQRDEAADRGTEVHSLAERLVKGELVEVPETLERHVENYVEFLNTWNPKPVLVEATAVNRRWHYCGQLDLVADLPNGERALLDLKGLALDTPIPTPNGWTTMGALQVGDELFGSDGRPCRVTAKSNVKLVPCYRMTLDDGSSVVADGEHRWATLSGEMKRAKRKVLTTAQIAGSLFGSNKQRQHRIPVTEPICTDDIKLPVEPYTLGCWLGDGTASDGSITKPDDELFNLITEASGLSYGANTNHTRSCPTRTIYGLRTQLREAGLLDNKHVPDMYLRASVEQRLALLQGLMDSDGTWNKPRHRAVFTTVDKALALTVRELALSLGERCTAFEVEGFGFGKKVTRWDVGWRPFRFNPFRLSRKADLVDTVGTASASSRYRVIKSVERTITVPTQCIEVDSADHTYLCGDQFIPTHNTGKGVYGNHALQFAGYRWCETYLDDNNREQSMTDLGITSTYIVHVTGEDWNVIPVEAEEQQYKVFQHLLWIYRNGSDDVMKEWLGEPTKEMTL